MNAVSEEQELWLKYRAGTDLNAFQQLFFRYSPWSRAVARDVYRRIRIPQVDWNDYVQNATIGLLEAMSRYDENRGIDFIAYAKPRVRGAVFNGLRTYLMEARNREDQLLRLNDRVDSLSEGVYEDSLDQLISSVTGIGLGMMMDSMAATDVSSGEYGASLFAEKHQINSILASVLKQLSDREREVLTLHYFHYMAFADIARLLGFTKGRISQIHKSAIENAKEILFSQGDKSDIYV